MSLTIIILIRTHTLFHVADDMEIMIYTKPKLYEKYGHIFYNITELQVNFTMGGLKLHLGNLFNGIQLLGESIIIIHLYIANCI